MTTASATWPPDEAASADTDVERLFDEHFERVFAYCVRRLGCRTEAEDAVQSTFVYALQARRRGVTPDCEIAWLLGIAKNVCRTRFRATSRRGPTTSVDVNQIAAPRSDNDTELLIGLRAALETMPERQRRALVLRELRGLPPREIAIHLGLSVPATHALLSRARHSLATALTVARSPVLALAWLAYELRSHLRALVGAASPKAAVAAVVVLGAGTGVGGIAIQQGDASDSDAPRERSSDRQREARPASGVRKLGAKDSAATGRAAGVTRPSATIRAHVPSGLFTRAAVTHRGRISSTGSATLPTGETHTTGDTSPTAPSQAELPGASPPTLPTILPVPSQPVEQLPPLELPTVEMPPVESPPVELPQVEVAEPTGVDVPPLPPLSVPPLSVP